MKGSTEIFTEFDNVVRIPRTMFMYMICVAENNCNTSDWAYTGYSSSVASSGYVNVNDAIPPNPQKLYLRIIPAGTYTLRTYGEAYLFTDDMGGKLQSYSSVTQ